MQGRQNFLWLFYISRAASTWLIIIFCSLPSKETLFYNILISLMSTPSLVKGKTHTNQLSIESRQSPEALFLPYTVLYLPSPYPIPYWISLQRPYHYPILYCICLQRPSHTAYCICICLQRPSPHPVPYCIYRYFNALTCGLQVITFFLHWTE